MNYWALNDALFEDGHYVEEWELQRFGELSEAIRQFIQAEASRGNKIAKIGRGYAFLTKPPTRGLFTLPPPLAFACFYRPELPSHFDWDGDGIILCPHTGEYLGPTGTETPLDDDA